VTTTQTLPDPASQRRIRANRWKLIGLLLVCAAPVIASYLTYYVIKPDGRTNYGALIDPQRGTDAFAVAAPDGGAGSLAALRGKWVMVSIVAGPCDRPCVDRLYAMRQVRLTTGKDRDRVERLLLVTGPQLPSDAVMRDYDGTVLLRAAPQAVADLFPADDGRAPADHVYVIDPLGNLMMRFPAPADPNRMKKDIAKLLRASRVG